jgi:TPP-dependent pyruvate/acetoin dehydrogenase alpha subunit
MTGIATELRLSLHRGMVRIRAVEEAIAEAYGQQEMRCPVHLCIGQEAPPVGVAAALGGDDVAFGAHRSHGHYLAKGGDLDAMTAELYGRATGCCGGKGGSMHLVDLEAGFLGAVPIVGSTIPIAVGSAFASKLRGEPRVTAVFFGEGATEEGVFHESILFAALKKLPVVFVCENNLYSVYSPLSVRQPAGRDLCALARANDVPAERVDGNDVEAVYAAAASAVAHARNGDGPTFLELPTYRWREHCGPFYDDDLAYRGVGEVDSWRERDPIALHAARLRADGAATDEWLAQTASACAGEASAALDFARNSPFPDASLQLAHVYPS